MPVIRRTPRQHATYALPASLAAGAGEAALAITWAAVAGHYYRVWSSNDLVNWTPVTQLLATSDVTQTVSIPTGGATCFFARVVLEE